MKDQLVHAHYERGKTIRLVGRQGHYEVDWEDVFYIRANEVERLPGSFRSLVGSVRNGHARVRWPEGERTSRNARLIYFNDAVFKPRAIEPLEADVSPVQRFLVENPDIQFTRDWRMLWFDIETEKVRDWKNPWRTRMLSFSWRSSNGRRGHVRAAARTDEAEREMLSTFVRLADRHDILLAWNGDRFDFPVIKSRIQERGVTFDPWQYHWLDHLRLFKRYYLRSEDGGVTSSFSLDAIAEAFLGQKKVPLAERARAMGWDGKSDIFLWTYEQAPALLEEYNNVDTELMALLEEKTGFIQLHFATCQLCRVLPSSNSLYPMTLVDGRMLQRGHEAGYHFPSRIRDEEEKFQPQARGAFVPEAQVGLHESVAVLDYARMYPSIIRTMNMSLDTLDARGELQVPETDEKGRLTGRTVARFRAKPEGHLPAALRAVLQARKKYSDRQSSAEVGSPEWHDAGRLSTVCKVLANTFYGVVLSSMSRFYKQEIGESVTSMGRHLLRSTITTAEQRGHRLIFGDTDSVAIIATCEQANALKKQMNEEVIPSVLRAAGVAEGEGEVAIDYEKRYARIVVTASKRYAGRFAIYKGKPAGPEVAPDVRGLEIVRSDVCRAARKLQREVLNLVLDGHGVAELKPLIASARTRFWETGAPTVELVLARGLTKEIAEYAQKPVQVRVAEKMVADGMEVDVGSKIPFLLTEGGAVHPSELADPDQLDRLTYWNKHIYPATERVLESAFPGEGWDRYRLNKKMSIRGQMEIDLDALPGVATPPPPPAAAPARPIRRVRPVRPIRRVQRPEGIVITIRDVAVDARRIKAVAETYPGPHVLRVVVVIRDGVRAEVELECPQRVTSPDDNAHFAAALRTIGATWSKGTIGGDG